MVHPTLALSFVALGAVLGAAGQGARAVVGLKKGSDQAAKEGKEFREWFDIRRLVLSLIIGAIAGTLGAVVLFEAAGNVTRQISVTLAGFGYAGTDFIEGFITSYLPDDDLSGGDGDLTGETDDTLDEVRDETEDAVDTG